MTPRRAKPLWSYDPQVPGETGVKACCDVVNRGLAAWGDKLFLGTLDGRLIALDRDSGAVAWEKVTVDQDKSYTITGAPRVVDGKVLIGNGGAEFGVRGYIAAYDAADGEELWRFYTVPGDEGDDAPDYLKAAAETWSGDALAGEDGIGGGGTVWDSMAYDPDLDLLYFGVGNGSPWNRAYRSPGPDGRGEGDNLYLSSIVAIRPDTGEYVWHYQTTPGETWDYTATQHIVLADMEIDGRSRQVLMQAPKNGYFYVLDRATGEFISGEPYIPLNWSTGMSADGRPQMNPETRIDVTGKPALVMPGPLGGHNWHPMAYHPGENLVYIPAFEAAMLYAPEADWKPDRARAASISASISARATCRPIWASAARCRARSRASWSRGIRWRRKRAGASNTPARGTAACWRPAEVWSSRAIRAASSPPTIRPTGHRLWRFAAQTGVVAPPITYTVNGEQYVAVLAGWGGAFALSADGALIDNMHPVRNISRLLVFKLGGTAALPEEPDFALAPLDPPLSKASAEVIELGPHEIRALLRGVPCAWRGRFDRTARSAALGRAREPRGVDADRPWRCAERQRHGELRPLADPRTRSRRSANMSSSARTRTRRWRQSAPRRASRGADHPLNTTVRWPLSRTRSSRWRRTASASTRLSISRPLRTSASGVSAWPMLSASWWMIGPSSRSAVT